MSEILELNKLSKVQTFALKMLFAHTSLKQVRLKATGTSMCPAIQDEDIVIGVPAEPDALKVGDIVVFPRATGGWLVMHRIVREKAVDGQRMVQTKGDGNDNPDVFIPASQVICRIVQVIPCRDRDELKDGGNSETRQTFQAT